MNIGLFINALEMHEICFFTGIPDSLLNIFCDEVVRRYGVFGKNHVVAQNEGGSVALASGYHLATGRVPCVYMQNSGIGNALNPVVSFTHPKVYGIPVLFIVGWRGEPEVKDEPQHIFQGEITLKLLKDMEISYHIVDKNTSQEDIITALDHFETLFAKGKSAAFVIRKSAFTYTGACYAYQNNYTLNREQAIKLVLEVAGDDAVVSTTGKISRELFEARQSRCESHEKDLLTVGSMGHSVMIALGISRMQPERRIWCLDGDGAILMHMGSMGIVGSQSPQNFVHVVFNNAAHETVGGMPTAAGGIDLPAIALACGYRYAHLVEDGSALTAELEEAKRQKGSVFIEARVALGSRPDLGRPTTEARENKEAFMRYLGKQLETGRNIE